jgi:hypothetical protein
VRFQVPNDRELTKARLYHRLSIVAAIVLFGAEVVAFGLQEKAWLQVLLLMGAWIAVEWQRRSNRRVKALLGGEHHQGSVKA